MNTIFLAALLFAFTPSTPQGVPIKLEQIYTTHERLAEPTALTRLIDARADKVIPLADGSWFVLQNLVQPPMTRVAYVVEPDGTSIPLRAGEWLPPGKFLAPGTMGQIFAATLLDDRKTMAVSFGWTNAGGRNLNGIAILDRKNGDWQRRNIIALDGAVRDLAAGPDGGILAVATRVHEGPDDRLQRLHILLLGTDGRIRAQIAPLGFPGLRDWNLVTDVAQHSTLQRLDRDTFMHFVPDIDAGIDQHYKIRRTGACTGGVVKRDDGVFLYPSYSAAPCYEANTLTSGVVQIPDSIKGWQDMRLQHVFSRGDAQIPIFVFQGRDEHGYQTAVTFKNQAWTAPVTWQAVRYLGGEKLEAIEQRGPGEYHHVTVELR